VHNHIQVSQLPSYSYPLIVTAKMLLTSDQVQTGRR